MTGGSGGAATRLRLGATTLGAAAALFMAVAAASSSGSASAETSRFLPWTEAPPAAVILKDLAGRPTSIADYHGKVVIVSFWATWCEFCREQMLAMRRLREQLAGQPFEIVAVNYGESPAKVREYVRSLSVEFPVILDPSQEGARAWQVRVLPVSFVVATDGRPRYTVLGEFDWASGKALDTIRELLR
jgi:thiol-disulfide isomerase/thioredoxin